MLRFHVLKLLKRSMLHTDFLKLVSKRLQNLQVFDMIKNFGDNYVSENQISDF